MRINYLILAHKNRHQLSRLIDKLLSGGGYVYIHLDKKWNLLQEDIETLQQDRVTIIKKRVSCYLDDWSLIEATLELLNTAFSSTSTEEKAYYYLLSGQDYPIKPIRYLNEKLEREYPKPFIDCTPFHKSNWLNNKFQYPLYNKILKQHNPILRKIGLLYIKLVNPVLQKNNLSKEFNKKDIEIWGGSAWWCLPDVIIGEILKMLKDVNLVQLLKKIRTPEEVVFQILCRKTSLSELIRLNPINAIAQDCLTYANFCTPTKLPYKGHPHIIERKDFDYIIKKDQFFARKFDENIDSEVLDLIDDRLS